MRIQSLETFTKEHHEGHRAPVSIVRVRTDTGAEGYGQISPYNADISATVFHRQIAPHALSRNPLELDINEIIEAEYKFPWSYVCRAAAGLDTALWDLEAKRQGVPVCELAGGEPTILTAYGSSITRDVEPDDAAARLDRLYREKGFEAFKLRIGSSLGRDEDKRSGRTEELVRTVHNRLGKDVDLYVDASGGYTPEGAIEMGRFLDNYGVVHFEEPCPFWELEQTARVRESLADCDLDVTGGEQDNNPAQWTRMIDMRAVDVVQPDVCYVGGFSRALQIAEMAQEAGLPCTPHSANHSLVTIFTVHLLAAIENPGRRFEFSILPRWASGMYTPELLVEDGRVEMPDGPGWGVEINPEWLAASNYEISEAK